MKYSQALWLLATSLAASSAQPTNPDMSYLRSLKASSKACEICSSDNKDKPDSLTIEYVPNGANSQFQKANKATCRAGTYPTTTRLTMKNKRGVRQTFDVTAGDVFQIDGPFSAETTFKYDDGDCYIHTSCSVPLVTNDQIGPFKIRAGNECKSSNNNSNNNSVPPADGTPEGTCEICSKDNKDKPEFLTIQYVPNGVNSKYQDSSKASCRKGQYPSTTNIAITNKNDQTQTFKNIKAGGVFTIQGPFDAETTFEYDHGDCYIHTSCSVPLVTNDQIGPFKMLAGNECNGDPESGTPPSEVEFCEICSSDNKDKPDSITLQYIPQGINSQFQKANKATCRAGTYPTTTRLTMKNKNGIRQTFDVTAGDTFTIAGPFSAETTFEYDDGDCYIHTSCSVPLVANDQIGPFRVAAGNSCGIPPTTVHIPPTNGTPEGTCEICSPDNKDKPEFLVIQYIPNGIVSQYQDSNKASCCAGSYPSATTLSMENKNGQIQTFENVKAGDVFTIHGPFNSKTVFVHDGGDCYIHTSCSAPLVTNDQIGPFKILAGNECIQDSPTSSPTPLSPPDMPTKAPITPPHGTPAPPPTSTSHPATPPPFEQIGTPSPSPNPTRHPEEQQIETLPPTSAPTHPAPVQQPQAFPSTPTPTLPFPIEHIETLPPTPTPTHPIPIGQIKTLPPTLAPTRPLSESNEGVLCEICSKNNGEQPDRLVLVYRSQGKESAFQDKNEASCGVGTYPESTTIIFTNKDKELQAISVQDGESFEIVGPFKRKTTFSLSGVSTTCSITLSCKVPLVAGDQLGPFLLVEGNDCKYETSSPTPAPSPSPSETPSISTVPTIEPSSVPSPSPSGFPSPTPSEAPTTSAPTIDPSAVPSPSPSNNPSPSPSEAPTTSEPTIEPSSRPSPSPSSLPSPSPSDTPSISSVPTRAPCVTINKNDFVITDTIEVTYNVDIILDDPLTNNGWICVYPCITTEYFHSYHWGCGNAPGNCVPANSSGEMVFSTGGDACSLNDQRWPIAPSYNVDGSLNTCHKVVILRSTSTAQSEICESEQFTVLDTVVEEDCIHRV